MANRRELRNARRKAAEAADLLERIERLPRRVGQKVRWSNGVVWTREGDDAWRAEAVQTDGTLWVDDVTYPSAHVASGRVLHLIP